MITASVSTTVPVDSTQQTLRVKGTLAFSGNYPANGDTLDLSQLSQFASNPLPNQITVRVFEETPAGTAPTGYQFIFCPGTTLANGKLAIFGTQGTQFVTGAYGAAFTGDVVSFEAEIPAFA